jgi:hypothetical protein
MRSMLDEDLVATSPTPTVDSTRSRVATDTCVEAG